jgi:hypothetical protein
MRKWHPVLRRRPPAPSPPLAAAGATTTTHEVLPEELHLVDLDVALLAARLCAVDAQEEGIRDDGVQRLFRLLLVGNGRQRALLLGLCLLVGRRQQCLDGAAALEVIAALPAQEADARLGPRGGGAQKLDEGTRGGRRGGLLLLRRVSDGRRQTRGARRTHHGEWEAGGGGRGARGGRGSRRRAQSQPTRGATLAAPVRGMRT